MTIRDATLLKKLYKCAFNNYNWQDVDIFNSDLVTSFNLNWKLVNEGLEVFVDRIFDLPGGVHVLGLRDDQR